VHSDLASSALRALFGLASDEGPPQAAAANSSFVCV
jgi:hypothetical protein